MVGLSRSWIFFIIVFIDDVLVYSKSEENVEAHLQTVLGCLISSNYMLNILNISFGRPWCLF